MIGFFINATICQYMQNIMDILNNANSLVIGALLLDHPPQVGQSSVVQLVAVVDFVQNSRHFLGIVHTLSHQGLHLVDLLVYEPAIRPHPVLTSAVAHIYASVVIPRLRTFQLAVVDLCVKADVLSLHKPLKKLFVCSGLFGYGLFHLIFRNSQEGELTLEGIVPGPLLITKDILLLLLFFWIHQMLLILSVMICLNP